MCELANLALLNCFNIHFSFFFDCQKLLVATHEDEMQAEMVHIKDELDKTGHELTELRKAKVEHIKIIEDLKVGYSTVHSLSIYKKTSQLQQSMSCILCLNFDLMLS